MSGKKRHPCVLCNAVLETKEALQEHFRKHANRQINSDGRTREIIVSPHCICELCGKVFETTGETIKHRYKVHKDTINFYCPYCGSQFSLKADAEAICKLCKRCTICFYFLITYGIQRDRHLLTHNNEKHGKQEHKKCCECDFMFYNQKALDFHTNAVHLGRPYLRKLNRPYVSKLTVPRKEHSCVLCDAKLDSKEALREHFRKHANNEIAPKGRNASIGSETAQADCQCDVCDEVFYTVREVLKHRFRVHPHSPKFHCPYCGKQFPLKHHMDKHLATHKNVDIAMLAHKKCSECDGVFCNDKALHYHRQSIHKRATQMIQPTATPPPSNKIKVNSMNDALSVYYCHLCGVEYVVKFNLQQHLEKVHTQEQRDAVPEKLIKCTMCCALFCSEKAYDVHNTYHKPSDLYVSSEQQRLKTITKIDQDFDVRRVSSKAYSRSPYNVKRRLKRQQTSIQKAGVVEQEDFGDASHSSDSQSDIPLNRRLTPCS